MIMTLASVTNTNTNTIKMGVFGGLRDFWVTLHDGQTMYVV